MFFGYTNYGGQDKIGVFATETEAAEWVVSQTSGDDFTVENGRLVEDCFRGSHYTAAVYRHDWQLLQKNSDRPAAERAALLRLLSAALDEALAKQSPTQTGLRFRRPPRIQEMNLQFFLTGRQLDAAGKGAFGVNYRKLLADFLQVTENNVADVIDGIIEENPHWTEKIVSMIENRISDYKKTENTHLSYEAILETLYTENQILYAMNNFELLNGFSAYEARINPLPKMNELINERSERLRICEDLLYEIKLLNIQR